MFIAIICMLFVPILHSSNAIVLRGMRDMNEYTIGSYVAFSMTIIYGPLIYFLGYGYSYLKDLQTFDWLIFCTLGMTSSVLLVCRMKSFKYEEPARLAVLNYFQSIIQFFFDVVLLDTVFTYQQLLGIAIVIIANMSKWAFTLYKLHQKRKKNKNDSLLSR